MELVSKTPNNNFWVEDYNQEEKDFFLSLGFKEITFGKGTPFENSNLDYTGTGMFGMWSEEEKKTIFSKTMEFKGSKKLQIYTQDPYR